MKKLKKNNRGITLVALVVTIVVLLILAGVTIVTLFGDNGIINKAQKAKSETKNGVQNDIEGINDLDDMLTEWQEIKDNGKLVKVKKGETEIEIGDYINYDCTKDTSEKVVTESYTSKKYDSTKPNQSSSGYSKDQTFNAKDYTGKWKVLGLENGELLIMSAANVPLVVEESTNTTTSFCLGTKVGINYAEQGKAAYKYAIEELDNISKIYAKGKGASGKARSIKAEDVNDITGYDPERVGNINNNTYRKNQLDEYENEVTYTWKGGANPYYTASNEYAPGILTAGLYKGKFTYWDKKTNDWITSSYEETGTITTLKSTYYYYFPETLTDKNDSTATTGILYKSKQRNMLFIGNYWLASTYVGTFTSDTCFGVRSIDSSRLMGQVLFYADGEGYAGGGGIRPVVYLKSNIKLEKGETDSNGITTWNIK